MTHIQSSFNSVQHLSCPHLLTAGWLKQFRPRSQRRTWSTLSCSWLKNIQRRAYKKKSNLCKFTQTDVTLTGRFPCPHAWCCQTVLVLSAVVQTERKAAAECGGFKSEMTVNITNSTKWCQLNLKAGKQTWLENVQTCHKIWQCPSYFKIQCFQA